MKKEAVARTKFFKNKLQMVVYIFLFLLFLAGFIYFGSKDYPDKNLDNEKFASEHAGANENNVFKYINVMEAYNLVKKEDAILFIGISNNDNVTYYANALDDVAKELGLDSVYYYDIEEDRKSRNATYESIVNYFSDYITFIDGDTGDLHVPTLIVKKSGSVLLFDDETAFRKGNVSDKDYWADITFDKKFTINSALSDYIGKEDNNG